MILVFLGGAADCILVIAQVSHGCERSLQWHHAALVHVHLHSLQAVCAQSVVHWLQMELR